MPKLKSILCLVAVLLIWPLQTIAAPDPEGVSIELDANNHFVRLKAVGESRLLIGDRSDVQRGVKVATLKAKAAIARYLSEDVTSEEVLTQTAESSQTSNGHVSGIARSDAETLTETIKNSSDALLKGIVILEQLVDRDNNRVVVTVGTSENTQKTADILKKAFGRDSAYQSLFPEPLLKAQEPVQAADSETRRSSHYDEF